MQQLNNIWENVHYPHSLTEQQHTCVQFLAKYFQNFESALMYLPA